jgi:hypothetical protein
MFPHRMIWFVSIDTNDFIHCASKTKNDLSGLRKELELGKTSKLRYLVKQDIQMI